MKVSPSIELTYVSDITEAKSSPQKVTSKKSQHQNLRQYCQLLHHQQQKQCHRHQWLYPQLHQYLLLFHILVKLWVLFLLTALLIIKHNHLFLPMWFLQPKRQRATMHLWIYQNMKNTVVVSMKSMDCRMSEICVKKSCSGKNAHSF